MRQWRLIYDTASSGARNMAIDEAILQAVASGDAPPTLRFYDWQPACLSLGYAQKASDVDFERLRAAGWQVVRRPTGGRAILHIDELTYSVALPADHPIAAGDVVASYRRISRALVAGLSLLGLSPEADRRAERGAANGPVCFEMPSHYEITINGRKLVGSAQVRRKGGVLQHGSLPLFGDVGRICEALAYAGEAERRQAKRQVRERAATLTEALGGRTPSWRTAAEAILQGFAQTFDVDFCEGTLSATEMERAAWLAAEVYGSEVWTLRR